MRNFYKTMATGVMVVALAGATGCATTRDLDVLKAETDRANSTASQAAADAAAAKTTANEALSTANATNEKLDRMFEKSMQK
jgi:murein lipoprotein